MNQPLPPLSSLPPIAFFGTSEFSVFVLEELERAGILPALLVTAPDRPKGRKLIMTPPLTKVWAEARNIPVFQFEKLDEAAAEKIRASGCQLFIVASYGKIIPERILLLAKFKTLNVHPSLLPAFRGASPLQSSILADARETGVTIIELDKQMDHGPILGQEKAAVAPWPARADILEETLARKGGAMLARIIPEWVAGKIAAQEQDHAKATFTKKIAKEDGQIDLAADPYQNFLKIQAFYGWPGTYFFAEKGGKKLRISIKDAEFLDGRLNILKVVPEGRKEISYEEFLRS